MINAQINHSTETVEKDRQMGLSTIRIKAGNTLEKFLVLHWIKGEISDSKIHTADQELINLSTLLSADLTIDRRVVSHLTNKNSQKTISRCPPKWCTLLQPTIQLANYSDFCHLNYYKFRTRILVNLGIPELVSISSISPPKTPKEIIVQKLNSCWIQGVSCSSINYRTF